MDFLTVTSIFARGVTAGIKHLLAVSNIVHILFSLLPLVSKRWTPKANNSGEKCILYQTTISTIFDDKVFVGWLARRSCTPRSIGLLNNATALKWKEPLTSSASLNENDDDDDPDDHPDPTDDDEVD